MGGSAAPCPSFAEQLVPVGSALVIDVGGRVVLQRRVDSGNWSLPGGVMELGETLGHAVVREARVESGLDESVRLRLQHGLDGRRLPTSAKHH